MIVYLKGNDIELDTNLSPIEFVSLVDIEARGSIRCSIEVRLGTSEGMRAGFIPLEDIDVDRTMANIATNPDQLVIAF